MRGLIGVATAALLFMSTLTSASAYAADANTAKARQLYEDGVTNYNLGHFAEALNAFEAAYRFRHDAAFLFNIAQCQRNLKRYEDAQRTYRAYLRESPDLPAATHAQIQQIMSEMDRALTEERAKQPPTGTQAPTGAQPTAPVSVAVSSTSRPPGEDEVRSARAKRMAGLAVGGFGVVAIGLGGVFTGLANDANRHIVIGDSWSPSMQDRRNTYQALDVAFFTIGGVAIAAGATLYLIGRRDERKRYPVERAQLVPAVGPHTATLTVAGGF